MSLHRHSDSDRFAVPVFESSVPPELLEGRSELEKRLYRDSSKNLQMMEWLVHHSIAQRKMSEEIKTQVLTTNGRLLTAEKDIRNLNETVSVHKAEMDPIIKVYSVSGKLVRSKYFWIGVAALVFIVIPGVISVAPPPAAVLKALGGLLFGG